MLLIVQFKENYTNTLNRITTHQTFPFPPNYKFSTTCYLIQSPIFNHLRSLILLVKTPFQVEIRFHFSVGDLCFTNIMFVSHEESQPHTEHTVCCRLRGCKSFTLIPEEHRSVHENPEINGPGNSDVKKGPSGQRFADRSCLRPPLESQD